MAKFTIELNVDWIDEDASVDEMIMANLARQVAKGISVNAITEIQEKAFVMIENSIDAAVTSYIDGLMTEEIPIYDSWGKEKGKMLLTDIIKSRIEHAMNQLVDKNGTLANPGSYDYNRDKQTRAEYLVKGYVAKQVDTMTLDIKKHVDKQLSQELRKKLEKQLSEHISKAVLGNAIDTAIAAGIGGKA
jgi:hypothetical protein